jgi:hypothetical protein
VEGFKMSELRDWPVKRLGRDQIRRDSVDLRKQLGIHSLKRFNFLEILRNRVPYLGGNFTGLQVIVRPVADLSGHPAVTHFPKRQGARIFITKDLEEGAQKEHALSQRILMHEFGHVRYHDQAPKAYLAGNFKAISYIEDNETSAEWQADEAQLSFAAPDQFIKQYPDPRTLAKECNLTFEDAKKAIDIFSITVKNRSEHPAYTAFKRDLFLASKNENSELPPDIEGQWLALDHAAGRDPFYYRLCPKGFLIAKEEYQKMTPCGWRFSHGIIEAYFNMQQ